MTQDSHEESDLLRIVLSHADAISEKYNRGDYADIIRTTMMLADLTNAYIARREPWKLAKDESRLDDLHLVCSAALKIFHVLNTYLKPIIPMQIGRASCRERVCQYV